MRALIFALAVTCVSSVSAAPTRRVPVRGTSLVWLISADHGKDDDVRVLGLAQLDVHGRIAWSRRLPERITSNALADPDERWWPVNHRRQGLPEPIEALEVTPDAIAIADSQGLVVMDRSTGAVRFNLELPLASSFRFSFSQGPRFAVEGGNVPCNGVAAGSVDGSDVLLAPCADRWVFANSDVIAVVGRTSNRLLAIEPYVPTAGQKRVTVGDVEVVLHDQSERACRFGGEEIVRDPLE